MICPSNRDHIRYAIGDMTVEEEYEYEQHILVCGASQCLTTRNEYIEEGDWELKIRVKVPTSIIDRMRQHNGI